VVGKGGACVRGEGGVVARAGAHREGDDEVEEIKAIAADRHVLRERGRELGHEGVGSVLHPTGSSLTSVHAPVQRGKRGRRFWWAARERERSARTLGMWIWQAERRALRTAVLMRSRLGSWPLVPSADGVDTVACECRPRAMQCLGGEALTYRPGE
jgi:hypothetical protein